MVSGSRLLLLDEPESALDFQHRYEMLGLIRSWAADTGGSAIVALHDPVLALNHCHSLAVLNGGEVSEILRPDRDSLKKMEQALGNIYGPVSLHRIPNRRGKEVLTMLKEEQG